MWSLLDLWRVVKTCHLSRRPRVLGRPLLAGCTVPSVAGTPTASDAQSSASSRQYLSRLRTRMVRPRPNRIEFEIDHPMAQRPAPFASTLVCQRQVVVRVGILRHQAYRFAIRSIASGSRSNSSSTLPGRRMPVHILNRRQWRRGKVLRPGKKRGGYSRSFRD